MDEWEILINNSRQKLEASNILYDNGFYSDLVNRAYYSMFFAARALLAKRNFHPRTHRGLISQFSLEIVKKGLFPKNLFDLLTQAQEDREESDYGFQLNMDKKEAKLILEGSKKFLKECERLL